MRSMIWRTTCRLSSASAKAANCARVTTPLPSFTSHSAAETVTSAAPVPPMHVHLRLMSATSIVLVESIKRTRISAGTCFPRMSLPTVPSTRWFNGE
jgi:hypothetical protein